MARTKQTGNKSYGAPAGRKVLMAPYPPPAEALRALTKKTEAKEVDKRPAARNPSRAKSAQKPVPSTK